MIVCSPRQSQLKDKCTCVCDGGYIRDISMRAEPVREHGGLDQLRIEDVPKPKFTENEVILKIYSAGLNHLNVWVRKGRLGLEIAMPHILGSEAAGVVTAVDANVKDVNVSDEVKRYVINIRGMFPLF